MPRLEPLNIHSDATAPAIDTDFAMRRIARRTVAAMAYGMMGLPMPETLQKNFPWEVAKVKDAFNLGRRSQISGFARLILADLPPAMQEQMRMAHTIERLGELAKTPMLDKGSRAMAEQAGRTAARYEKLLAHREAINGPLF